MTANSGQDLFLGLDLSTQQLKVIVTDSSLKHLETFNVEFDQQFGEKYSIKKGVLSDDKSGEIVSPVNMWLESIDFVFSEMKRKKFPFDRVCGISGSCQQHGSVYWSKDGVSNLTKLNVKSGELVDQLTSNESFTFPNSPNWQDHSTGKEIEVFELIAGDSGKLAELTGSRAHYRFTGLQIRKLAINQRSKYQETERISLVSSFLASVLLGKLTEIEQADACGMNIYDISKQEYNEEMLALTAGVHPKVDKDHSIDYDKEIESIKKKLGEIKPITYKSNGEICQYFVDKYGFKSNTKIYSFTGDNLATILSLPLAENDILVSLGTSTTVLLVTKNYCPSSQYHLFKHPTMPEHYMGMICYCNGSLAREKVRDQVNEKYGEKDGDWKKFDEILNQSTHFDNQLGIYFPLGEIVPNASAQIKRSKWENDKLVDVTKWENSDSDVTSIIESQTLSCRLRLGPMLEVDGKSSKAHDLYNSLVEKFGDIYTDGKKQNESSLTARPKKVYFVGGALNNMNIVKKMSSILGLTEGNYRVEIPNACALGGAFKASWGYACETKNDWIDYNEYISDQFDYKSLEEVDTTDRWEEYFQGIGMLAEMEKLLKKD